MPPFDALFAAWTNFTNTFGSLSFGGPGPDVGSSLGLPFLPSVNTGS